LAIRPTLTKLQQFSDDRVPVTWNTNGTYRRNGDHSERMAIYGNSRQYFYRTPHTFFGSRSTYLLLHSQ